MTSRRMGLDRLLIQRLGFSLLTLVALLTVIPIVVVVGFFQRRGSG